MSQTILTLSNGKGIDLTNPKASDIDFVVIAEHLAKEKRYNGATPGVEYSVAQHCVIGADAALADTGSVELAAYVLLHDGKEAFIKDDTTPKKRALAAIASKYFGILSEDIIRAFYILEDQFDAVIHRAAGLQWPPSPEMVAAIKAYDLTLFVTEWRDLMRGTEHPAWDEYRGIEPLRDVIKPIDWHSAAFDYRNRCKKLLPTLKGER